tara:strand:- start:489 stop:734 length:246 start_codon:yes stop_codon:yes gene_type:complete
MSNLVLNLITSPISTIITLPYQIVRGGINLGLSVVKAPISISAATIEHCVQNNKENNMCEEKENNFDNELVDIRLSNTSRI